MKKTSIIILSIICLLFVNIIAYAATRELLFLTAYITFHTPLFIFVTVCGGYIVYITSLRPTFSPLFKKLFNKKLWDQAKQEIQ